MGDAEFAMSRAVSKALLTLNPEYKLTHHKSGGGSIGTSSTVVSTGTSGGAITTIGGEKAIVLGDHPVFIETLPHKALEYTQFKHLQQQRSGGGSVSSSSRVVGSANSRNFEEMSSQDGDEGNSGGGGAHINLGTTEPHNQKQQQIGGARGGGNRRGDNNKSVTNAGFEGSRPGIFGITAFTDKMKQVRALGKGKHEREVKRIRNELGLGIEVENDEAAAAKLYMCNKETRFAERSMRSNLMGQLLESVDRVKQARSGASDPYGNSHEHLLVGAVGSRGGSDQGGSTPAGAMTPSQYRITGGTAGNHHSSNSPSAQGGGSRNTVTNTNNNNNNSSRVVVGVLGSAIEQHHQSNKSGTESPGGDSAVLGATNSGNPFPGGPLTKKKSSFFATALHDHDDTETDGGMTTTNSVARGGGVASPLRFLGPHTGGNNNKSGAGTPNHSSSVNFSDQQQSVVASPTGRMGGGSGGNLLKLPPIGSSQQIRGHGGDNGGETVGSMEEGGGGTEGGARRRSSTRTPTSSYLLAAGKRVSLSSSRDGGGHTRRLSLTGAQVLERHHRLMQFQDTPITKLLAREVVLSAEEQAEKEATQLAEAAQRALGPTSKGAAHTRFRLQQGVSTQDFNERAELKIAERERERKNKYWKKFMALELTGPALPFHATPEAILHHVEKVISRDEKLSNRQEAYDRERAWFDQLSAFCAENYHHPAVTRILSKTDRLICLDKPSPEPSQFYNSVFPLLQPTEILLQDVAGAAIHVGKIFGVSKADVIALLRKTASGFIVDRRVELNGGLDPHDAVDSVAVQELLAVEAAARLDREERKRLGLDQQQMGSSSLGLPTSPTTTNQLQKLSPRLLSRRISAATGKGNNNKAIGSNMSDDGVSSEQSFGGGIHSFRGGLAPNQMSPRGSLSGVAGGSGRVSRMGSLLDSSAVVVAPAGASKRKLAMRRGTVTTSAVSFPGELEEGERSTSPACAGSDGGRSGAGSMSPSSVPGGSQKSPTIRRSSFNHRVSPTSSQLVAGASSSPVGDLPKPLGTRRSSSSLSSGHPPLSLGTSSANSPAPSPAKNLMKQLE